MPPPSEEAGGEEDRDGDARSFFADRLAEVHDPYRFDPVELEFTDDDGPYREVIQLRIAPPDDVQVAALDDCADATDELEVLAGDEDAEDLFDVLAELGIDDADAAADVLAHFCLDVAPLHGWAALVERLNLYGAALEHDLFHLGWDLLDWFRGRWSWDHLLRQASRLPTGSHYMSAVQDDDELAEQIAEVHGPLSKRKKPGSNRPRLEGFTIEVAYMHQIVNALKFIGWATFAAQAGKKRGSPPKPDKGPETADERYDHRDYIREHQDVASRLLVDNGPTPQPADGDYAQRPSGLWEPNK